MTAVRAAVPAEVAVTGGVARAGGPLRLRALGTLLVTGGTVGLIAAAVLTVEKLHLAADPTYVPSCSINPVLSCGSVMSTPQAEAFGFPNSLLGVAGFPVVIAAGVALLSGAVLPRRLWLLLGAGTVAGGGFVHWLAFQSIYRIGALCPYCLAVWAVTIPVAWYVLLEVLTRHGGARARVVGQRLASVHAIALTAWFVLVASLITVEFWSYWSTLLR